MYQTVYCVWLEVPDLGNNPATNNVVPLLPPLLSLSPSTSASHSFSLFLLLFTFFLSLSSLSFCLLVFLHIPSTPVAFNSSVAYSLRPQRSPPSISAARSRSAPFLVHSSTPTPSSPSSNARRIRGFWKPYAENLDALLFILCRCHSVVSNPPSYSRPLLSQTLLSLLDFAYCTCRRIPAASPARRLNASHPLPFGSGVGYFIRESYQMKLNTKVFETLR